MLLARPCDVDALVRQMAECSRNTTSNSPQDYGAVLEGIEEALDTFWDMCSVFDVSETTEQEDSGRKAIEKIHRKLVSTVHFYAMKLEGLESFIATTQSRLKVQRKMIKAIVSQKNIRMMEKLAAERFNASFIDQNWNQGPRTKSPAVFGQGHLPMFSIICFFSLGLLAMKLINFLLNQLKFVSIGLEGGGDTDAQYDGPSMRPVDIIVYIVALAPMAVFITLLYKSGKRKGATITEWGMEKPQEGNKGSPHTNGKLP
ncbi:unnamed protein product [Clonostachys rosea]|uniref:Uncharacterized protein n=1 Tax=Bionectria ochroleuca TaxID=29856 RepID=A0ABY6UMJ1_BIOOC|nr:unnamed protein product [Clonostachys rosea]